MAAIDHDTPPLDTYRVRTWPSRRWRWFGPRGWRFQLDRLTEWDLLGDESLLGVFPWAPAGLWHRTREEALEIGVEDAHWFHDRDCHESVPLLVLHGERAVVDTRAADDPGDDGEESGVTPGEWLRAANPRWPEA